MEQALEQIRDQQKDSWDKFSPGWKKWDGLMMDFLRPMGEEIIRRIAPKEGEHVLDIASGTGEPGLTIAESLGKSGRMTITDVSPEMLKIAAENAEKRRIKVDSVVCDVCELPFADDHFDAISCRFGFMFFPEMSLAAKEMFRVLKPGGRFATSVWDGPDKNLWVTAAMGTINRIMELSPPPVGSPGMFRCADKEKMQEMFRNAGFKNVSVSEVQGKLMVGTAETYWNMMTEVAAPFVAALSKADTETRDRIKKETLSLLNEKFPDGKVNISAGAIVIYGEK